MNRYWNTWGALNHWIQGTCIGVLSGVAGVILGLAFPGPLPLLLGMFGWAFVVAFLLYMAEVSIVVFHRWWLFHQR